MLRYFVSIFLLLAFGLLTPPGFETQGILPEERSQERILMVKTQIQARGISDNQVLEAMKKVPRHLFVPSKYQNGAYGDFPLPIGYGQTISQPYIVALMTQLLSLKPKDKVLEIGTGSGYQAAILAEIVEEVYTVEIIEPLFQQATERLKRLGYKKVMTLRADGYFGWKEHAPFDAIIVTAAADHIPPPLLEQLKRGGRMCLPVGPPHQVQRLVLVRKGQKGEVSTEDILPVSFVPLRRTEKE